MIEVQGFQVPERCRNCKFICGLIETTVEAIGEEQREYQEKNRQDIARHERVVPDTPLNYGEKQRQFARWREMTERHTALRNGLQLIFNEAEMECPRPDIVIHPDEPHDCEQFPNIDQGLKDILES